MESKYLFEVGVRFIGWGIPIDPDDHLRQNAIEDAGRELQKRIKGNSTIVSVTVARKPQITIH